MVKFEYNEFTFGCSIERICSWIHFVDLPSENIDISKNQESYRMYNIFDAFTVCVYKNSEHYAQFYALIQDKDYIGVRSFCETLVLHHATPALIKQCINDAFDKGKQQGVNETQLMIRAALGV